MSPLLQSGQDVMALMGYYVCHTPERGDIVLVDYAGNDAPLIKVIRGLPGDVYAFEEDGTSFHLRVNNEQLANSVGTPYTLSRADIQEMAKYARTYGYTIPPSRYLMLGDTPRGSMDSTHFGFMSENTLIAKVGRPR